ncbi:CACTA en-spm transposon protein [Cucumis melo var. makuwa]|uniref:CACTA en-spm transposon protein n=1 Tax=Cucumis melo var. makuwa TaxID=1194695 RepID=A0A5D3DQF6_CUCMM|nr:CACTA en-spm transposon protein [Cucumis melo var. makuwa]
MPLPLLRSPPYIEHELAEKKGELIDCVELFRETHVQARKFVSQAVEDMHNQMLELQSQPTPEAEGPQDDECEQFHDVMFAVHRKKIELQAKPNEALNELKCKMKITKC